MQFASLILDQDFGKPVKLFYYISIAQHIMYISSSLFLSTYNYYNDYSHLL